MAIGLVLALGLNRRLPARAFLRSLYFLPVVVSTRRHGDHRRLAVQRQLRRHQRDHRFASAVHAFAWLSSPYWALPSLIVTTLWVRVGFCMVVYLAALQSIPPIYYEAARDRRRHPRWQQFRYVTWPLLRRPPSCC